MPPAFHTAARPLPVAPTQRAIPANKQEVRAATRFPHDVADILSNCAAQRLCPRIVAFSGHVIEQVGGPSDGPTYY
jgi:hypothetical protein